MNERPETPVLRVSRRNFLRASGVGLSMAAASTAALPFAQSQAHARQKWDAEYDVVVVGSGAAGFGAAIAADHLGSKVAILEKGTYAGGTTFVSGGVSWIPNNHVMRAKGIADPRLDALKYMAKYSWPHLYNPDGDRLGLTDHDYELIAAYYDSGPDAMQLLQDAGAVKWGSWDDKAGTPYIDYMDHMPENRATRGRAIVATTQDGTGARGSVLIAGYIAHAKRKGIPLMLNHRVDRVVLNASGEVIGIEATVLDPDKQNEGELKTLAIRARKGVIFGSGGFARNKDYMHHLMPFPYVGGCSAPTNEGDFLRIAAAVNAKMSHLDNVWRNESLFEQLLANPVSYNCIFNWSAGDSFLMVNRYGRRFVNEKRSYQLRGQAHLNWDANQAEYTNRLTFAIYDGRVQENWPGFYPFPADVTGTPYIIAANSIPELAGAIEKRLKTLSKHTGGFSLDTTFAQTLVDEVKKFNGYARTGKDLDFQRGSFAYDLQHNAIAPTAGSPTIQFPSADQPNSSMYPLREVGPYYAVIVTGGWFDTNGGPVINAHGQILNWSGTPIRGLYGAGNCVASAAFNAYWGGGTTIGNAHVWGVAAARHAAASKATVV
jgi:succinate dehydrogenase/fumarate reductase flavoprotein subunit